MVLCMTDIIFANKALLCLVYTTSVTGFFPFIVFQFSSEYIQLETESECHHSFVFVLFWLWNLRFFVVICPVQTQKLHLKHYIPKSAALFDSSLFFNVCFISNMVYIYICVLVCVHTFVMCMGPVHFVCVTGREVDVMEKVRLRASELTSCEWCNVRKLPVLFFQTSANECQRLRQQLHMSQESGGLWYDCTGNNSEYSTFHPQEFTSILHNTLTNIKCSN